MADYDVDEQHIRTVVKDTLGWPPNKVWDFNERDTRTRSVFGVPCSMIAIIWNKIWEKLGPDEKDDVCKKGTPQCKYLLYALLLLKVYSSEEVHCSIVGWPTAKTFRKWSWFFVRKISNLKDDVIQLERRFENLPEEIVVTCFVSVDGTDCPVFKPWPFDTKMCSHKMSGLALKYEVAVAISTGFIVWVNGPFKGRKRDYEIFMEGLKHQLYDDENIEVDSGYKGDDKFMIKHMASDAKGWKEKSNIRSRHENVNSRLKLYNVLTTHFRHMKPTTKYMEKHKMIFDSVAVITQLMMESGGSKLYNVEYNENYYF